MIAMFCLSMVTASVSFTVTEMKLCKPMREWAVKVSPFLGELLSCGYCLGHWVALILVALYQPRVLQSWWVLDFFVTVLIVAWMAGLQWIVMCMLFARAGK
jgi:hypothetical protein